jgi:hypothetical protein
MSNEWGTNNEKIISGCYAEYFKWLLEKAKNDEEETSTAKNFSLWT